ncbi:MAG: 50S ribosomal protein L29 [Elusimicrobia bacterium]|nr:50S ribosomal protein L29 [Elusimicrobiota bacterium]
MKRREKESLRSLSVPELESEYRKRRTELFEMKFQKYFKKVENPLRARYLRREIAALATWIRDKSAVGSASDGR